MLKEYTFEDLYEDNTSERSIYIDYFESLEDREVDWPHNHAFHSLVWFTEGSGSYVIDYDEFEIKPNRIFYVAPLQIHNWSLYENIRGYVFFINPKVELGLNFEGTFTYLDLNTSDQLLHSTLLGQLQKELTINDFYSADVIRRGSQFYLLLLSRIAQVRLTHPQIKDEQIDKFKKLILDHFSSTHPISFYANILNMSQSRLNSICKRIYSISAKQYLLNIKISESKRLIIYTDMNINEITYHVGFEDSSYFARIFKKKVGISPTEFMKKYRKQN